MTKCNSTTLKGTKCKNNAIAGSDKCSVHSGVKPKAPKKESKPKAPKKESKPKAPKKESKPKAPRKSSAKNKYYLFLVNDQVFHLHKDQEGGVEFIKDIRKKYNANLLAIHYDGSQMSGLKSSSVSDVIEQSGVQDQDYALFVMSETGFKKMTEGKPKRNLKNIDGFSMVFEGSINDINIKGNIIVVTFEED